MMATGESQLEARGRKVSLANPKRTDRMLECTHNVCRRTAMVVNEMRRYKLSILGVSEVRWLGFGRVRTSKGEVILYSGAEEIHHRGVGIILNREAQECLMEWAPINERIIRARFYSRFAKTTVLQTYAPTNEACEEEKEDFYEQLHREIEKTPKHDILLLMGDVNAKVRTANEQWKGTIGTEGIEVMNENGELFLEFCAINDLVIGGTLFKHKDIHKFT